MQYVLRNKLGGNLFRYRLLKNHQTYATCEFKIINKEVCLIKSLTVGISKEPLKIAIDLITIISRKYVSVLFYPQNIEFTEAYKQMGFRWEKDSSGRMIFSPQTT